MIEYQNPNDHLSSRHIDKIKPEEAYVVGCLSVIGYVVVFAVALLICALLNGCKTCHCITEQSDSIMTEIKTETFYVPDTTYITIPVERVSVVVKDSTSHLENDYAISDAKINRDGTLHHSLTTKPKKVEVPFQKPIITKDSIKTRVITKTSIQKVEIEKPKSWWDKTKSYGFYILVILTLLRYRKSILKLVTAFNF